MRKLHFKAPTFHLSLQRLPQVAMITMAIAAVLAVTAMAWLSWGHIIQPYQQQTVSEDKLTKKLDTLNVKDFTSVQAATQAKTKVNPDDLNFNPFEGVTP